MRLRKDYLYLIYIFVKNYLAPYRAPGKMIYN